MGKIFFGIIFVVIVVFGGSWLLKSGTPATTSTVSGDQPIPSTNFPKYSSEQVAEHGSEANCWTIVRGNVYDVTPAVKTHPGGPDKILAMCGKNATEAFVGKHGGMPKQETGLEKLQIGVLGK